MMEVSSETAEFVKKVCVKTTRIRWTVDGFYSKATRRDGSNVLSKEFVLDESTATADIIMHYPVKRGDGFSLEMNFFDLRDEHRLDVQCECWLENKNGEKRVESAGKFLSF
jgi:hypothetical protein